MASLGALCPELLQGIFENVNAEDLVSLSGTCHAFKGFVKDNQLLWRSLYLREYDDPTSTFRPTDAAKTDWESAMQSMTKLRKLLESKERETKRENFSFAATKIVELTQASKKNVNESKNIEFLNRNFEDWKNIDVFCSSSSLFTTGGADTQIPASTEEDCQLSAQINVLWGSYPSARQPHRSGKNLRPRRSNETDIHPYARSRVYDLRRYTTKNMWGPFKDDGSEEVDWEKLEAIQIDLRFNLSLFADYTQMPWATPFGGCARDTYISTPYTWDPDDDVDVPQSFAQSMMSVPAALPRLQREASLALDQMDPYGVTGTWARVVCFLDYNDLFAFNFTSASIPWSQPREPISIQEAIRIIVIKMQVTAIEPPGPDDGQDLPVVHYKGTSKSRSRMWDGNANSLIRGTVRLTRHGAVRWTSFSIFDGEERWRSEGIQVGGVRSARGVLGNWFDKDFDEFGPAGPTAYWKLSDDLDDTPEENKTVQSSGAMGDTKSLDLPIGTL